MHGGRRKPTSRLIILTYLLPDQTSACRQDEKTGSAAYCRTDQPSNLDNRGKRSVDLGTADRRHPSELNSGE